MAETTIEQIRQAGGIVKDTGPYLTIKASGALTMGQHTFDLVVTDESGKESTPFRVTVSVVDAERPNASVSVMDVERTTIFRNNEVPNKTSFLLNAEKSFDPDGSKITSYVWKYVGPNIR